MKYSLGLDLGIASIGWALMQKTDEGDLIRIENLGVRIFPQLEDGKTGELQNAKRREKRGQRRLRRRKNLRLRETKEYLNKYFNINFDNIDKNKINKTPYEIKIKGLTQKLTPEELAIAVYHYVKYRGFKSNRKIEDKEKEGVLLDKFSEVEKELSSEKITISKYLWDKYQSLSNEDKRIHNTGDNYIFTVTRKMYIDEMNILFDTQEKFGIIKSDFKDAFLNETTGFFTRQRSFSVGPSKYSPYGAKEGESLIEKRMGKCIFDGKLRAPKGSFSAEAFVLLSFLNNMKISENDSPNYRNLLPEEIKKIYNFAMTTEKLTYKKIFKELKLDVGQVKGLEASKKIYIDVLKKYKSDKKILDTYSQLSAEQYKEFRMKLKDKLFDTQIPAFYEFYKQEKIFKDYLKNEKNISKNLKDEINGLLTDKTKFDVISKILTTRKVDSEIVSACMDANIRLSKEVASLVCTMKSLSQTINLSTEICQKLIPELLEGHTYDKAMENIGYNHSDSIGKIEKVQFLPSIEECCAKMNEQLTNVNVKHTLVELRKLLNAIIKKYGSIDQINIELARELSKNLDERRKILNSQKENMENNIADRTELIKQFPDKFRSYKDVKGTDLLKYRLYVEQNRKCAYSNTTIATADLFDDNKCQIDHIMPYSKTFEDRAFNKVLVFTKYNQEKGDRIPYEAFKGKKWDNVISFVNDPLVKISQKKKDILLAKEIDYQEWIQRNLNDTKYASKLAMKIVKSFLQPVICRAVSGSITDLMKKSYGFQGVTHSFISNNYKKSKDFSINKNLISFKNDQGKKILEMVFVNLVTAENLAIKLETVAQKGKKELSKTDSDMNMAIEYFNENQAKFLKEIDNAIIANNTVEVISSYIIKCIDNSNDVNQKIVYDHLLTIFSKVQSELQIETLKKDRNNHLHHVIDAIMIACVTDKIIQKITKFAKQKDLNIDEETGEIIKHPRLEMPYKDFRNEILYRLYERNYDVMISKLSQLSNYKNVAFPNKDIYVTYPSRSTNKNIKGAFTDETICGVRNNRIIKRLPVDKITKKNIDKIIDKDCGQKAVYESVKEWFDSGSNKSKYPILKGKGSYIKKVMILESNDTRKRVELKRNTYASNATCIRVDVYKRKGDDNTYYMVPIYYIQLVREKQNKKYLEKGLDNMIKEINYEIMWGTTTNHDFINEKQLKEKYMFQMSLPRYSLIEIETEKGKGTCYSGGCSSGYFQIYSILGDDFDLEHDKVSFKSVDKRMISISTIKNMKLKNISKLGKLN